MNRYKSSSQLKSLAKGQLLGKYPSVIGAFLIMQLISLMLSGISGIIVDTSTWYGMIINYLVSFISSTFMGIFWVGQTYIYLNISCGRPCKASDIFYGFTQHTDKALLLMLIEGAINLACGLPFTIITLMSKNSIDIAWVFPICMAAIISVVLIYYFMLAFSLTFYLLLDFPDYSVKQILSLSMKIMKGHKARMLYIMVSTLPLMLLGLLSCGIGLLWVMPYYYATMANFYLDLMRNRQP